MPQTPTSHQRQSPFARNLRRLRLAKDMTLEELANAAKVSTRGNISAYEHGRNQPNTRTLTRLARALKVSVDDLLGARQLRPSRPMARESERGMAHKVKLTVSVDEQLARDLRAASREMRRATSHLVEEAISLWRRRRLEEELRRGYQAMAPEDRATAGASLSAVWAALR